MGRFSGNKVSMENYEDIDNIVDDNTPEPDTDIGEETPAMYESSLTDTSETPESLMVEADGIAKQEDEVVKEIEEDDVAIEQLMSYRYTLDDIKSLDAISAKLLFVGLENIKCLNKHSLALPSMESFTGRNSEHATNVSQEGIMDVVREINEDLGNKIVLLLKKGVAVAQSMTPVLNSLKTRANKLANSIDQSKREAGMKEVSGSFATKLSVNGITGSVKTIFDTAKTLLELNDEILHPRVYKVMADAAIQGATVIKNANPTDFEKLKIGNWQLLLFFVLVAAAENSNNSAGARVGADVAAAGQLTLHEYTTRKNIKINRSILPSLFKLFPKASKHDTGPKKIFRHLDSRRSDPVFDGTVIAVYDFNEKLSGQNLDFGWADMKVVRVKFKNNNNKLPTLTSKEQKELVDIAISLIDTNLEFWHGYEKRLSELKRAVSTVTTMMQEYERETRKQMNTATAFFRDAVFNLPRWYYRMYFNAAVGGQKELARYNTGVIKAMLEYVTVSMHATQND